HLYAELGDRASLRQVLDEIAAIDLTRNYVDGEWLLTVGLLPDALRVINDTDLTAGLYDALAPREALYTQAPIEITFGSVARGLGVLATVLERFDEAEGHFVVALEVEQRMRALPWIAHAQHDFGAMLIARNRPGDPERGRSLANDAVAGYRALGMDTWAE